VGIPLSSRGFVAASVPPGRAATRHGLVQNVQVVVARGAPAKSLMAFAPSVGVTRYCTLATRLAFGFNVSTRVLVL
jgi:hypothetical protein